MALFVFRDGPNALLQVHIYLSWEICQHRTRLCLFHSLFSLLCHWKGECNPSQKFKLELARQLHTIIHVWNAVMRGGGLYEPCSNRQEHCYKHSYLECLDLFFCHCLSWNDTLWHPEGVKEWQVRADSSNFSVACKRQYPVEALHTHMMDFPRRRLDWCLSEKIREKGIVWCSWH